MISKRIFWGLAGLAIVALVAFLWRRQAVPEVGVAPATLGTAVNAVTGTVEVFSHGDVRVKTEREGRLAQLHVGVGEWVEKGQLLAEQDSLALQYRIAQERARYEAAKARRELPLAREFDQRSLREEIDALRLEVQLGQTSRNRLEQTERELSKLEALLAADRINQKEAEGVLEARLEEMNLELEKMQIRAPFAGEVVGIFVAEGSQLGYNAEVLRIVAPRRLAEMTLNEEDFSGAAVGQRVILRLASWGGREFVGEVESTSRTSDAETKTRTLIVKVDNSEELAPGSTGEGYLVKGEQSDAVLIPRRALRGNRVWVVDEPAGVVRRRRVEPGFLSLHQAEIVSGLEAGELVVLEDQDFLTDGQRVRLKGPSGDIAAR
ncbi:MAG: efflux RND transporter periplasmic adaptor subunit [Opitutales bacterium]